MSRHHSRDLIAALDHLEHAHELLRRHQHRALADDTLALCARVAEALAASYADLHTEASAPAERPQLALGLDHTPPIDHAPAPHSPAPHSPAPHSPAPMSPPAPAPSQTPTPEAPSASHAAEAAPAPPPEPAPTPAPEQDPSPEPLTVKIILEAPEPEPASKAAPEPAPEPEPEPTPEPAPPRRANVQRLGVKDRPGDELDEGARERWVRTSSRLHAVWGAMGWSQERMSATRDAIKGWLGIDSYKHVSLRQLDGLVQAYDAERAIREALDSCGLDEDEVDAWINEYVGKMHVAELFEVAPPALKRMVARVLAMPEPERHAWATGILERRDHDEALEDEA